MNERRPDFEFLKENPELKNLKQTFPEAWSKREKEIFNAIKRFPENLYKLELGKRYSAFDLEANIFDLRLSEGLQDLLNTYTKGTSDGVNFIITKIKHPKPGDPKFDFDFVKIDDEDKDSEEKEVSDKGTENASKVSAAETEKLWPDLSHDESTSYNFLIANNPLEVPLENKVIIYPPQLSKNMQTKLMNRLVVKGYIKVPQENRSKNFFIIAQRQK